MNHPNTPHIEVPLTKGDADIKRWNNRKTPVPQGVEKPSLKADHPLTPSSTRRGNMHGNFNG